LHTYVQIILNISLIYLFCIFINEHNTYINGQTTKQWWVHQKKKYSRNYKVWDLRYSWWWFKLSSGLWILYYYTIPQSRR